MDLVQVRSAKGQACSQTNRTRRASKAEQKAGPTVSTLPSFTQHNIAL